MDVCRFARCVNQKLLRRASKRQKVVFPQVPSNRPRLNRCVKINLLETEEQEIVDRRFRTRFQSWELHEITRLPPPSIQVFPSQISILLTSRRNNMHFKPKLCQSPNIRICLKPRTAISASFDMSDMSLKIFEDL